MSEKQIASIIKDLLLLNWDKLNKSTQERLKNEIKCSPKSRRNSNSGIEIKIHREGTENALVVYDKATHVHPGITCNGCLGDILGIRFKCATCSNFNLCEACKSKSLHREHPLIMVQSLFGFEFCNECGEELTRALNICISCTKRKLPLINSNERVKFLSYYLCDSCKAAKHFGHAFESELVADMCRAREKLSKGKKIGVFCGLECHLCGREGVSFYATTRNYHNLVICDSCFLQGLCKHYISFAQLNEEKFMEICKQK